MASGLVTQPVACFATTANEPMLPRIDHDFRGCGMAEKLQGTGGSAVGTGLKHADQVTDGDLRQQQVASQNVQGRAKRTRQFDSLVAGGIQPIEHGNGIVPFDRLAEVSGSGEVMMHATVKHRESFAARLLDVDHS